MKTYEFNVVQKVVVTQENLNDLLVTAVEGGIDYWAFTRNYRLNDANISVDIMEIDAEKRRWITVKASDLVSILHRLREFELYPMKKGAPVEEYIENMDANVADVAVQLLLFGKEKYA
jgi:hypothetical protein